MIYVSHNPTEVLCVADWIVVIREGKVVAQGVPRDVLTSKRILSGLEENQVENVFETRVIDSDPRAGRSRVRLPSGQELFVPPVDLAPGSALQIRIRGDDIIAATKRPEGISAANVLPGIISGIETVDGESLLRVDAGEIFCVRVTTSAVDRLNLAEGQRIFLVIKTRSCLVL
jgi:molybdate transport system ATP-binding protein